MRNTHKSGVRGSVSKYTDAEIRAALNNTSKCGTLYAAGRYGVSETTFRRWRKKYGVDGQAGFGTRDEFERFQRLDTEIEKLHQELRKTLETGNRIISDSERECAELREKLAETEAMRTASVIETAAAISESAKWRYNLVAMEKFRDYWCNEARESRLGCEAAETSARESLERLGRVEKKLCWWQRNNDRIIMVAFGVFVMVIGLIGLAYSLGVEHK